MQIVSNRFLDQQELPTERWVAPRTLLPPRAHLLHPADQMLLRLLFVEQRTFREMGAMLNHSPGALSRRVKSIIARLRDPMVMALSDHRCPLAFDTREIGLDFFLRGMTFQQIARERVISAAMVRKTIVSLRAWHRGLCAGKAFESALHRPPSDF